MAEYETQDEMMKRIKEMFGVPEESPDADPHPEIKNVSYVLPIAEEYINPRPVPDKINPAYYKAHPAGVQCLDIIKYWPYCLGAATKYIWRVADGGKEGQDRIQDLKKAIRYIEEQIRMLEDEEDQDQEDDDW